MRKVRYRISSPDALALRWASLKECGYCCICPPCSQVPQLVFASGMMSRVSSRWDPEIACPPIYDLRDSVSQSRRSTSELWSSPDTPKVYCAVEGAARRSVRRASVPASGCRNPGRNIRFQRLHSANDLQPCVDGILHDFRDAVATLQRKDMFG